MKNWRNHPWVRRLPLHLIRYGLVQVTAYAVDMGLFIVLSHLGAAPLVSNAFSKIASAVFSYNAHQRFTFSASGGGGKQRQWRQIALYFGLMAVNIPIASVILSLLMAIVSPLVLAKFLSDVACVFLSYLQTRYIVFRRPAPPVDQ